MTDHRRYGSACPKVDPQKPQGRGTAQIYAELRSTRAAFARRPDEMRGDWVRDAAIELELDAIGALEREAMSNSARSPADAIAALLWLCEEVGKEMADPAFMVSLAEGALKVALQHYRSPAPPDDATAPLATMPFALQKLAALPLTTGDKTHDTAAAALAAATDQDPLLSIYAQLRRARAEAYDRRKDVALSDEDLRAVDDEFIALEQSVLTVKPATIGDAIAAMRWAHEELHEFHFAGDREDPGSHLVLTLIEGALGVLGRSLGSGDRGA